MLITKFDNNFLQDFFADINKYHFPSFSQLKTKFKENDKKFILDLELPGFSKDDISISVDNKILSVSAERKKEVLSDNEKIHFNEFSYGSLKRSFSLPSNITSEDIIASFENGILSIEFPKQEFSEVKKIEIK